MEITGDADALVSEVLAQARAEAESLLAAAEAEAGRLAAAAAEAAEEKAAALLAAALAAAGRRRAALLAAVPVATARWRAARTEALLEGVRAEAAGLLPADGAGGAAALARFAARGAAAMDGNSFVVITRPGDGEALRALAPEIERLAGKGPLALDFEADGRLSGGLQLRDTTGRQLWDDSFAARLERLWPRFRSELGARLPGEAA